MKFMNAVLLLGTSTMAMSPWAVAQATNTFPSSGNVGIGTTNPITALEIGPQGNSTTHAALSVGDYDTTASEPLIILNNPGALWEGIGYDKSVSGLIIGTVPSLSNSPGWTSEQLTLLQSGNVGIATTSPTAKLEVNGNLKLTAGSGASITFADGTTQSTAYTGVSCGGDWAESVDVTGQRKTYTPGDLIIIDAKHPGKFMKSVEPYSTAVLGVYSTKPGFVGRRQTGPKIPDEIPMAMVGIVPVKVTTENGPIKPGDLLVSSSTPGFAMKGTDRLRMPGAIIGKALDHLDSGSGVIEVGVTLQ